MGWSCGTFHRYVNKVLPLVFDESLSYYECLLKLQAQIAEVIKELDNEHEEIYSYINSVVSGITEKCNAYTDAQIEKLTEDVAELWTDALNKFAALYEYCDNSSAKLKNYTDLKLKEIWEYILNLSKVRDPVIVINPITGRQDELQNALNDIAYTLNIYGITCGEYDAYGLTCEQYAELGLTCYQYDYFSKSEIEKIYKSDEFQVRNPETGEKESYKRLLDWLVGQHKPNALTCAEYEAKEYTVKSYDDLALTCYAYDWNGKRYIV